MAEHSVKFRILAAESGWGDVALQGAFFPRLSVYIKNESALRDETTLEFANHSIYKTR